MKFITGRNRIADFLSRCSLFNFWAKTMTKREYWLLFSLVFQAKHCLRKRGLYIKIFIILWLSDKLEKIYISSKSLWRFSSQTHHRSKSHWCYIYTFRAKTMTNREYWVSFSLVFQAKDCLRKRGIYIKTFIILWLSYSDFSLTSKQTNETHRRSKSHWQFSSQIHHRSKSHWRFSSHE